MIDIRLGDCLKIMATLDANSIDAIVTDPPYFLTNTSGNGFMGKTWDSTSPSVAVVVACFKLAHLVCGMVEGLTVAQPVNTPASAPESPVSPVPLADESFNDPQARLSPRTSSAHQLVITKGEAVALCSELLPRLTNVVRQLPDTANFVVDRSCLEDRSGCIARNVAVIWHDVPVWLAHATTFLSTDGLASLRIEEKIGPGFVRPSINEINGPASSAESTARSERFNVTTSSHTENRKIITTLISSRFVSRVIRECMSDPAFIPRLSESFHRAWAIDALRVAKPGAHLLVFGSPRTFHRLAAGIEDAGWECRDTIMYCYGSGFPKSLDVSKAIDKRRDWSKVERLNAEIKRARAQTGLSLKEMGEKMQAATDGQYGAWYHRGGHMFFETGMALPSRPEWEYLRQVLPITEDFQTAYEEAEREILTVRSTYRNDDGWAAHVGGGMFKPGTSTVTETVAATSAAQHWQGYGTALKPSYEPILICRKPLDGTVAQNVLKWGVGALNIDGCRIDAESRQVNNYKSHGAEGCTTLAEGGTHAGDAYTARTETKGRWPANFVHDGSAEVLGLFPEARSSGSSSPNDSSTTYEIFGKYATRSPGFYQDHGSAARFFYTAKASGTDRGNEDWDALPLFDEPAQSHRNAHPTVKPLALMRYLLTLVSRDEQLVLDPFAGSGSTLVAAKQLGRRAIGCELDQVSIDTALRRLKNATPPPTLLGLALEEST